MSSGFPRRLSVVKATNLADLYKLPLLDWGPIEARVAQGMTQAARHGRTGPAHVLAGDHQPGRKPARQRHRRAGWVDGAFWFETGDQSRKARNLARDPRCTLSVATQDFDLVVDGDADQVTDPPTVAAMAERWAAEGWPARVDDTGRALTAEFSAPSAGPPPWFVYRLTPRRATALATIEPGGATRWTFGE